MRRTDEPESDTTCRDCSGDARPAPPVAATGVRSHREGGKAWRAGFHVAKYRAGETEPYETLEVLENIGLNAGLALMLDLLIGAGGTSFAHANARICVGDGTTAAVATQTDLQGTNKLRKAVDTSYPTRSAQTVTWQATFGSTDANFHWQEWCLANSASGATVLNRKVADMGIKESGETWIATATITAS
jgi:hypothetical protein